MPSCAQLLALAERIDPARARVQAARIGEAAAEGSYAYGAAVLLSTAYPALTTMLEADPRLAPSPHSVMGERRAELATLDDDALKRALRRYAHAERMRIALREVLPASLGGADLEHTARELSDLADETIEIALSEAKRHVFERLGTPRGADGELSQLTVLGMGKLGGQELNAGSDVDLVCFYDSDACVARSDQRELPAHEVWTKVIQRMTANLEDVTEDGFVWRVDLRLRPEGARGPLVNSLAAVERYYESFGRLWERAAWLRARAVAGDIDFGQTILDALSPFVWTRRVDPSIANSMYELVHRARTELSRDPERDLKLGPGGIREAEFFVQTLQLIWGGRDPRIRVRSTIEAAAKLRSAGLVTEREAHDITVAYVALRRAEHAVQVASGVQTHSLPREPDALRRLARTLGFDDADALNRDLDTHTERVGTLLRSLLPTAEASSTRWSAAIKALDRADPQALGQALKAAGMPAPADHYQGELSRDLFEMSRQHPDSLLGSRTRERLRPLVDTMLDAMADAADPVQAARYLRGFVMRVRPPGVYTKLLAYNPAAVRRLVTALGGSAFVAEAVASRPERAHLVLFERGLPNAEAARDEVLDVIGEPLDDVDDAIDQQVGRLRRIKGRITTQVALADLGDEIDTRTATLILSAVADGTLEAATRLAMGAVPGEPVEQVRGLAVIAMGKLGGREIGYGSDLDVIFLYDPAAAPNDPLAHFSRAARRVIQLITMPHMEGRGYELDTRLRPSGSHGLLVVSLDAFARYHDVGDQAERGARAQRAATWERLALLRSRFAAGDARLGRDAIAIAHRAAYEGGGQLSVLARDVHRLRLRMEQELAKERPGRYDLKFGRGGLVDIEFCAQLLQLKHGADERVRTSETRLALAALDEIGALEATHARALRQGYAFLRRLEQRLRVLHADGSHLIEEQAAGLVPLARRMGIRDLPGSAAAASMIDEYRAITGRVRDAYEAIVEASAAQAGPEAAPEGAS
jgi:glutamate-ammonia-ligase adenylyltransferase